MSLKYSPTERGFKRYNFEDQHRSLASLQESSLVGENCIWFGSDNPTFYGNNDRPIEKPSTVSFVAGRMHLNQQQVAELLPLLRYFVDTGYLPAPDEIDS